MQGTRCQPLGVAPPHGAAGKENTMTTLTLYELAKFLVEMHDIEVPINLNIDIHIGGDAPALPPDDGGNDDNGGGVVQKPDTVLVVMIKAEAYKYPKDYNAKGKPIMDNTYKTGFRAEVGDTLEVYFPSIQADGGARYFRVWRDQKGQIAGGHFVGDVTVDLYLARSRTKLAE